MVNINYEMYKKKLGESGAKLIREHYPEGLDSSEFLGFVLRKCKTRTNARNVLSNIENLLYLKNSYLNEDRNREEAEKEGDLEGILGEQGYEATVIGSVDELKAFKKSYAPGEVLCTYNSPESRLRDYHIIILAKKGFKNMERGETPQREDDYSTSLLNVQVHKRHHNVSIKSRYNHTVSNPDAVHSNNLERVAPGLTNAVERRLGIKIDHRNEEDLPDHLKLVGDHVISYWTERNNVYVGEDVYVDNDDVHWIDPNQEVIADYFLINFREKTVKDLTGMDRSLLQEDLERAFKANKLDVERTKWN